MNLNKSLACLLSAATFISSMPNIEAADNKFKKVFNTIINSKPALCAIGASGLAAIIGGGVLIAHNRKTKKANSKSKTDNYTVKFRLKNSPQDEWPQGAKEVLCKLERAEGCPNAICIKLPDPKDSATASFLLQNLKLNELKTKLEKLLTENTGSVDLNEKYVMSLEPSEGDDTKLPQLNLTEYMNALDQTYQAHEKRDRGIGPEALKSAAAEGPSSTPEQPKQPEHGGDDSAQPSSQPPQQVRGGPGTLTDEEIEETYEALCDKLGCSGGDQASVLKDKHFSVIMINGVTDCKYAMYKDKETDEYIAMPYPEHRDNSEEKPHDGLDDKSKRKIYWLARSVQKADNEEKESLKHLINSREISKHNFDFTGNPDEDKAKLRTLSHSLKFTDNVYVTDFEFYYAEDVISVYIEKVKKKIFPKSELYDQGIFCQLTSDAKKLQAPNPAQAIQQYNVYRLDDEKLLMTTEDKLKQFIESGHIFDRRFCDMKLLCQNNAAMSATKAFLIMMFDKNVEERRPVEHVDEKLTDAIAVTELDMYKERFKKYESEREERRQKIRGV